MTTRTEIEELRDRLAALEQEVVSGRRRIAQLEAASQPSTDGLVTAEPIRRDRRSALRLVAGAAAGAAGAMVASAPAAADDPNDITLGQDKNHAGGVTVASSTSTTDPMAFVFEAGNAFPGTSSIAPAALGGWTSQSARPTGVFGYTTQPGGGVVGIHQDSPQAIDVPAGVGVFGASTSGAGVTGRTFDGNQSGVTGSGGRYGVSGAGTNVGVRGQTTVSNVSAFGVSGSGGLGTGVYAEGERSAMLIRPNIIPPPQRVDGHRRGEIDASGSSGGDESELWYCVQEGSPGTWRKLAGPSTAGAFHPIEPVRTYDSREPVPLPGALAAGASRVVDVSDGRAIAGGAVVEADVVPAGATALAFNIAVTQTVGGGFLSVTPGDATTFKAATINWDAAGRTVANASVVKLDTARQVKVFCGGVAASTHFVIDVVGYYA